MNDQHEHDEQGYEAPNYTQTPNALFDEMPSMREAELRVTLAIVRKTFGWHKRSDEISLTQLQELTGLSRQGVLNGLEDGRNRGTITQVPGQRANRYSLIVHEVDQSTNLTSTSQLSRPEVVNEVDTQKKLSKETKDSTPDGVGTPQTAAPSKKSKARDLIFEAVLSGSFGITYTPGEKLPSAVSGRVNKCAKALKELVPPPTGEELQAYYADYPDRWEHISVIKAHDKLVTDVMAWREWKAKRRAPVDDGVKRLYTVINGVPVMKAEEGVRS